jgi:hypothetical protein
LKVAWNLGKVIEPTGLNHPSAIQDEDSVGIPDCFEAMGDENPGASQGGKILMNLSFCFKVQGTGGFIQDQDRWAMR